MLCKLFCVFVLIFLDNSQSLLWDDFPISNINPGRPVNCVKEWSRCYTFGTSSYRVEEEVEPARNGGICVLDYQFDCHTSSSRNCVKAWGPCLGSGPSSVKEEYIVTPASDGVPCELKKEYSCNTAPCRKRWGSCSGFGANSFQEEVTVSGYCRPTELRRRYGCNNFPCRKAWGECIGTGRSSYRVEMLVSGYCAVLETEYGCNIAPVDCTKRWGKCKGEGPSSFQDQEVVSPARDGGKCELDRKFGCNPYKPVPCKKQWGKCTGNGPKSEQSEVAIQPAKHGGICNLRKRKACRFDPVECVKEWGKCVGEGPNSMRKQRKVTNAMYGGVCKLETEKGCNPYKPVDCVKEWGECKKAGKSTFRDEKIVTPAKNGGECVLDREFACDLPEDCIKMWGECIGVGESSYRKEEIKSQARYGGKACSELKFETGCNMPKTIPVHCEKKWGKCVGTGKTSFRDEEIIIGPKHEGTCDLQREFGCDDPDDTPGKETATLFLANFVADGAADEKKSGSAPSTRRRAGARSLIPSGDFGLGIFGHKVKAPESKNCTSYESKTGKVLAVGCDDADNIDKKVMNEEDRLPIRTGEKVPAVRTKRSTQPGNPVTAATVRDAFFYLDSSGSVGPVKFRMLKKVCKAIVDVLCGRISLGKYQTRIAMGTFNKEQKLGFSFSQTDSVALVKKLIDGVRYDYKHDSQSCLLNALKYVLSDVYVDTNGARDPSYAEGDLFIMTDGCANCNEDDAKELQRWAYRLKRNKINVYAIGIGLDKDCRKSLEVLARGGRCFHFFFLDDWKYELTDFLYRLEHPPEDRCLDRWEYPGVNCLDRPT